MNRLVPIVALKTLLPEMPELPEGLTRESDRALWRAMLERLPAVPTRDVDGHYIFPLAVSFNLESINLKDPQLYVIFPYPLALPDNEWWQISQDTWDHDDLAIHFLPCWG